MKQYSKWLMVIGIEQKQQQPAHINGPTQSANKNNILNNDKAIQVPAKRLLFRSLSIPRKCKMLFERIMAQ